MQQYLLDTGEDRTALAVLITYNLSIVAELVKDYSVAPVVAIQNRLKMENQNADNLRKMAFSTLCRKIFVYRTYLH